MQRIFHPRTLFVLGLIALALLLSLLIIIGDAFEGSFWKNFTSQDNSIKEQVSTTSEQPEDPLITVVPKDVRGGYPQPLPTDPKRGATNPKVVMMMFGDFQCENCKTTEEAIRQILIEYPNDVQQVWKDFPIPSAHPYAESAAIAARCAGDQGKFWEMHDALFEKQGLIGFQSYADFASSVNLNADQFQACINGSDAKLLVVQGYMIARSFSLTETPTVYINKTPVVGAQTVDQLRQLVQDALK
ncbi:MAG: DsbA family protein [Candidatus Kerfeldbacteria bacterium]|nr:DsbA family protein [Candidatus Kerfeldbacteria bacterium]